MFYAAKRLAGRLLGAPRLLAFRARRALAVRRSRHADQNNYPMR